MTDDLLHTKLDRIMLNQQAILVVLNSIWKNTFPPSIDAYGEEPQLYTPWGLVPVSEVSGMIEDAYENTREFFEGESNG